MQEVEVVIATHNQGKMEEFKTLMQSLGLSFTCLNDYPHIEEPEETGRTFAANARLKAVYYAKALNKICLADDSGLEVLSLKGAPGVRSARYAGEEATAEENNEKLLNAMKMQVRRNCRFFCALAVATPDGKIMAESAGICEGILLHEPHGTNGFGYDPLFWSTELHKPLGEATMEEKNGISHRAKAIRKLVNQWRKKK
jgi:XTP/dITP diphosphohydrolase